jgi:hypothetical protein
MICFLRIHPSVCSVATVTRKVAPQIECQEGGEEAVALCAFAGPTRPMSLPFLVRNAPLSRTRKARRLPAPETTSVTARLSLEARGTRDRGTG